MENGSIGGWGVRRRGSREVRMGRGGSREVEIRRRGSILSSNLLL